MLKETTRILRDFGVPWAFNRSLYSLKLKTLNLAPQLDFIFEKKVEIKQLDLFDFEVNRIKDFLKGMSEEEQIKLIESADRAIEGKLLAFSSQTLDYGNPINWHLNPITGQEHNKHKKWFSIPDFDKKVGDIKVIWEASRFSQFVLFARAYLLTEDLKYYESFKSQLLDWLKENDYSYGANYKCGQEATIRMTNLLMTYAIFNKDNLIDESTEKAVYSVVEGSYKKVLSNFFYAHKCIKNNHTFTEILGRIIGAWCANDKDEVNKSMNLMDSEVVSQFTKEGGFRQYSTNYQRFTLQIFEVLFNIESKIDVVLKNREIIERSAIILYNMMNENGYVPNYGSNDGALIFPMSNASYRDFRPVISTIYAQTSGKKILEPGLHEEEMLWFSPTVTEYAKVEQTEMRHSDIGLYSFKDDRSFALLHFNEYKTRPAHMDQLHFELWYKDIDIFTDQGTFSYASELGAQLSINEEHNTVYIKDKPLMNKKGAFMVYDWSKIEEISFDGNHFKGKLRSRNGYTHQRDVLKTKTGFEINDLIEGVDIGFSVNFHTPLEVKAIDNKAILSKDGKDLVELISDNSIVIEKTYRSLYYLEKEEINKLSIKIEKGNTTKTIINLVEGE